MTKCDTCQKKAQMVSKCVQVGNSYAGNRNRIGSYFSDIVSTEPAPEQNIKKRKNKRGNIRLIRL